MSGITLGDAAQQFIDALAKEHKELRGVKVKQIDFLRHREDGWIEYQLVLSNHEKMLFEVKMPASSLH